MPAPTLSDEYQGKLAVLDQQLRRVEKTMRGLAAEAKVDAPPVVGRTLERKSGVLVHVREDLAKIPQRVQEDGGQ